MLPRQLRWVIVGVALSISLAACNLGKSPEPTPDVNALYTEAAATLITQMNDQLTQTAQAAPPTLQASPTPLATFTPLPTFPVIAGLTPFGTAFALNTPGTAAALLPTSAGPAAQSWPQGCNDAQFIGETIPDGTKMNPLHDFKKAWSMLNVGTCTWDEGYEFAFKSGEQLNGVNVKIKFESQFTKPGHSQAFVVHMDAPKPAGEYIGYWQMKDDSGNWFGSLVRVDIIVQ
jgi:hypothetical protein